MDALQDGVSIATTTSSYVIPNFTSSFRIGGDTAGSQAFNGHIDEFSFHHAARWTAAFTPRAAPYFSTVADRLILTRGQKGSVASTHDTQDRAQLCLTFDAQDPADIIADLIEDYTDTPAGYVQRSTWLTETGTYLNRLYTATIAEPTAVNKLISEIVEQGALAIWDDNVNQAIRLQVLRGIVTDADRFSEANVMKPNVLSTQDQPDKRASQVWVYFGQIDPTQGVDNADNYRSTAYVVDSEAEANYGAPAIRKIYGRWIPALGRTVAERLGEIVVGRYRDPPRKFSFNVLRGSVAVPPILGSGYRLEWWNLQDAFGDRADVPIQVTRLLPSSASYHVDAEEMLFSAPVEDLANRLITIDANINNVNWNDVHDSLYPEIESGQACTLTIAEGVVVGSTGARAFDVGTWPGGVTLNLIVLGRIEGKGGVGGNGGTGSAGVQIHGTAGAAGGIALYTRTAINLTDASGELWGGGGGGGGGGSGGNAGGGGGGGAGQLPGTGGTPGEPIPGSTSHPGGAGTTEAAGSGGAGAAPGGAGGAGGGPGLAGTAGTTVSSSTGGAGGAAGKAIDGIAFVTTVGSAGDRRGGTV